MILIGAPFYQIFREDQLPDVLRTECYEVIIQISRELRIAKDYLGNGLPELGLTVAV